MNLNLRSIVASVLCLTATASLQAQDCNCQESFEKVVDTYEKDYSLFIYKVTDDNRALYQAHTDVMRSKAKQAGTIEDCKSVLDAYLAFFRDGHTAIEISAQQDTETYSENLNISESQFKTNYQEQSYGSDPLLGIWNRGNYSVGIMPNASTSGRERDYVAVILKTSSNSWAVGDVKFELSNSFGTSYQINYMMGDHSINKTSGKQIDLSTLNIETIGDWQKVWPETETTKTKSEIELKFNEFHLSFIEDIPYLRLPDFYSVDRSYVDSILKQQHEKIIQSDVMIVDVRGNSGGSDATYFPVLPYLLDGPIELPMNGFWLSDYNTDILLPAIAAENGYSLKEFAEQEKEAYEGYMANKGGAYFQHEENYWTFKADTLYNGPKKVIVLADDQTASSGETFVYRVNQSKKVVVYGQNTAGVVDGFNGLHKNIGCFELVFPSSFRAKDLKEKPIDPYGIAPDVFVESKDDVLSYAIEHMKQLIKNQIIKP